MSRAGGLIPLLTLLLMVGGSCAAPGDMYTDIGPFNDPAYSNLVIALAVESSDEQAKTDIQRILSSYALTRQLEMNTFDCSDVAEIDWYILSREGYNCTLMANRGYNTLTGNRTGHMFTWVKTDYGVVVVDPTYQVDTSECIGRVLEDVSQFYLQAWKFGAPSQAAEIAPGEVRGITLDTPITDLPIKARTPEDARSGP